MVIRLEPIATMDFDDEFDAGKIFQSRQEKASEVYSVINGENYSINSIPWPEKKTVIPLTLNP